MHYGFYPDYDEEDEIPDTVKTPEAKEIKIDPEYKCVRCGDWFKDVHPNEPDNKFRCYCCRSYPYR